MGAQHEHGGSNPAAAAPQQVQIRRLTDGDLPALRALDASQARRDAAAGLGHSTPASNLAPPRLTPAAFAAYVADGCSVVAVRDERVVGYLLARPLAYVDERPLSVWVDDVVVHSDFRSCAIAEGLLRALQGWARAEGVRALLTRLVAEDEVARTLHRSIGVEPHAKDALICRLDGRWSAPPTTPGSASTRNG